MSNNNKKYKRSQPFGPTFPSSRKDNESSAGREIRVDPDEYFKPPEKMRGNVIVRTVTAYRL